MAWKSASFTYRDPSGRFSEKVDRAADKHKEAMRTVVEQARDFSRERQETLEKIVDPRLRKSASQ